MTTIAAAHRCQAVNAATWRVEYCNGKRWELVAMIERAETGRYRRRGTNEWGRVRLCDCVAELVARFLEAKTQGEFMSEQIDYTWRPDGFPPAEAGWYYPKDGVRMAGDVWINKRHNGQIERGSELHARGFNIGNSVNICSEWVQRRIPSPVAESKGEACPCGGTLKFEWDGATSNHIAKCPACIGCTASTTTAGAAEIIRRMYAASLPATPASEDGLIEGLRNVGRYYGHYMNAAIRKNTTAAITRIQSDAAKIKEQGEELGQWKAKYLDAARKLIDAAVRAEDSKDAIATLTRERDEARASVKWMSDAISRLTCRNADLAFILSNQSLPATCRTKDLYHASDFYGAGNGGVV